MKLDTMFKPHADDTKASNRIMYWLQNPMSAPKQFDDLMFQVRANGMDDACNRIEGALSHCSLKPNDLMPITNEIASIRHEALHKVGESQNKAF